MKKEKTSTRGFRYLLAKHREHVAFFSMYDSLREIPNKRLDYVRRMTESLMLAEHGIMLNRVESIYHLSHEAVSGLRWRGTTAGCGERDYSLHVLIDDMERAAVKYKLTLEGKLKRGKLYLPGKRKTG